MIVMMKMIMMDAGEVPTVETLVQSLKRKSSPLGWIGSTAWLTSINQHSFSHHRMLYLEKKENKRKKKMEKSGVLKEGGGYSDRSACTRWHTL
jgi:hypothetical protein